MYVVGPMVAMMYLVFVFVWGETGVIRLVVGGGCLVESVEDGGGGGGCGCVGYALPLSSRRPRRWSSSLQPEGENTTMTTGVECWGSGGLVSSGILVSASLVEAWS